MNQIPVETGLAHLSDAASRVSTGHSVCGPSALLWVFLRRGLSGDFVQLRRSGSCIDCPRHEELMIVKIAVHESCDLSRFGPEGRMSALQEDDRHDAPDVGVSVRGKPPVARAGARTCPGLA